MDTVVEMSRIEGVQGFVNVACGHVTAQTLGCCVDTERHVVPTERHPDHRHPTRCR